MGKKKMADKKRISSFLTYMAAGLLLLGGCATPPALEMKAGEVKAVLVEGVDVDSSPGETVIEVINSGPAPYTVFKLTNPPRIILDIMGEPGPDLPMRRALNDGNIGDIIFEEGRTQAVTTRMTATLTRKVDYAVTKAGNKIRLTVSAGEAQAEPSEKMETEVSQAPAPGEEIGETKTIPTEPRILFKPKETDLNQVLGIDFTMLDQGRSRLTITTDKKVPYDLERKGAKVLILKLSKATIPSLLQREIDTTHFQTALEKVKPSFSKDKKEVSIAISLKEPVPFHVKQSDKGIYMDFDQAPVRPPDKKIVPLEVASAQTTIPGGKDIPSTDETGMEKVSAPPAEEKNEYKGEPMYLDFVNADVTHILRLINEISKENIIWDPAIAGRKVSMILKNVPWDEALELILKNNDLAKRYVGTNIVWITTKEKMKQILAEEEAEGQKLQRKLEDERKRIEEEAKKAKEEEPLVTEYIPVDFATASDIKDHITLTTRGTMSIDTRTNTIIIKDTAESIKEAKKTVKQFDTPVKQIMIEARIVDATDSFTRDLGLQWTSPTAGWRKNTSAAVTYPPDATNLSSGDRAYGGTFTTNAPSNWAGNIGLTFARMSPSGLGALTLDASLALAESEGKAKTLSAPKVIAREGTAATIASGDSIVIPATENVASTTLDATLSLTVTPTSVSYNDFITMDVAVTDDQAPTSTRLLRKSISTTLMVKTGETVVIGGIIKETKGDDETGVPGLRDIPGLGWLFKARRKTDSKSELLIFLTPTVLPSPVKEF